VPTLVLGAAVEDEGAEIQAVGIAGSERARLVVTLIVSLLLSHHHRRYQPRRTRSLSQPPLPPARDVVASYLSSDDDDHGAPEVMSTKRPSGNETYESSLDAEPVQPQVVNDHDHSQPGTTFSSSHISGPADAATGPSSTPTRVESTDHPRRTRPPQPKKPPRNPFAARSSLLRNVSKRICYVAGSIFLC